MYSIVIVMFTKPIYDSKPADGDKGEILQSTWNFVPISEEHQYLLLIRFILSHGVERMGRTGTGTKSIFGVHIRYVEFLQGQKPNLSHL